MRDIVERLGQIADDLDGGSYPDSYPGDCMEAACEIRALRHKLAAADLLRDLAAEQSMKHAGTIYDLRQQLAAAEARLSSIRNYCEARNGEFLKVARMTRE